MHAEAELHVECSEVFEGEPTDLLSVMLVEQSFNWCAFSAEAVIELGNPILKHHPLEAPGRLELPGSLFHFMLEVCGCYRGVFALILQGTTEFFNFVASQTGLKLFQALRKFNFSQSARLRL